MVRVRWIIGVAAVTTLAVAATFLPRPVTEAVPVSEAPAPAAPESPAEAESPAAPPPPPPHLLAAKPGGGSSHTHMLNLHPPVPTNTSLWFLNKD